MMWGLLHALGPRAFLEPWAQQPSLRPQGPPSRTLATHLSPLPPLGSGRALHHYHLAAPGPRELFLSSLSACLCVRLRVRQCGGSSEPWALAEGGLSGLGWEGLLGYPCGGCGSHFLFSDGSQRPVGWLCRVQALAPIASGDRDDSCGQASDRQASRGKGRAAGLHLSQMPIIAHPLACPSLFQDYWALGGGQG